MIVGRGTTSMRIPRNLEFGSGFAPSVWMFFVSWKSDAKTRMNSGPGWIGFASLGIEKTAIPVAGSYCSAPSCEEPKEEQRERIDAGRGVAYPRDDVGRPVDTRRVISWMFGARTSFTQERSLYGPVSDAR